MTLSLSKALKYLQGAGYAVPENAIVFARDKEFAQRGLACVWTCRCGYVYESIVMIKDFDHNCGKSAKQTWPHQ